MLVFLFLRRRVWHIRHHWTGHLATLLLFPLALYFTLEMSMGTWLHTEMSGITDDWLFPGLLFIIALLAGILPLWSDLQRSISTGFVDNLAASPNGSFLIVISLIASSAFEILFRTLGGMIILIILVGHLPDILPLLGTLMFSVVVGILGSSLVCLWLLTGHRRSSHFFGLFTVILFIIFSSGWLIPIMVYPANLASILSWLPTSQLMTAGRSLFLEGSLSDWSWLLVIIEIAILVILSASQFRKVRSR